MNRIFLVALFTALAFSTTAQAQMVGNAANGSSKVVVCGACHGASGNDVVVPGAARLGGQNQRYLYKQLQDIKSGARDIALMAGQLNSLSDQDLADIAAHYASLEEARGAAEESALVLGQTLYRAGNADIGVAACSACHSPTGAGNNGAGYPALRGQDPAYTESQLRAFRDGTRNNDLAAVMQDNVARLNDAEIQALASYVAGLRAE
ncbi:MAG: cytochrome c4 [SAR86 cluster bacterium]|uniref:Cytochrome c4 n=1 Tax=SAR86 cluster bacterium TaxID=2030880 RepID=A0A2A5CJF6_9GAMM|nr:cytochrome c4 [Gammaproteobacteria bacterium AH-315-E17]PCJ43641.1 MAG: cytochrome c4 [SAR86 cluster bacterium]